MGSGSGVLAVAVAVLTGATIDAFDIAPQAEAALLHNARLNDVSSHVKWRQGLSAVDDRVYDIAMANILAPVLRELASALVQ